MARIKKEVQDMTVEIQKPRDSLRFGKAELLQADCLRQFRDIAGAVLVAGEEYTLQGAMDKVNEFMKGKVK